MPQGGSGRSRTLPARPEEAMRIGTGRREALRAFAEAGTMTFVRIAGNGGNTAE